MDTETRLFVLDELYRIFDEFINTQSTACAHSCDSCCTCNVTLTTLEGLKLVRHLEAEGEPGWALDLRRAAADKRFRPMLTTNRLAVLCAADEPIPEERSDPGWGRCPFLSESQCPVYGARPFACRCMVSSRVCRPGGHADMEPLAVTVGNVFMQTIEHLDVSGCSGNLVDVLGVLADEENRRQYESGGLDCARHHLIGNQPMTILMVPPEHRKAVQPLLEAIHAIRIPAGGP